MFAEREIGDWRQIIQVEPLSLTLGKGDAVSLAVGLTPAGSVTLRVTAEPGPVNVPVEGSSVTLTGEGRTVTLISDASGLANVGGLTPGAYTAAVSGAPANSLGALDLTQFTLPAGGRQALNLTLLPPAFSDDLFAPDVSVNPPDVTAPGAEPLVTISGDSGAESATVTGPDGANVTLLRQPDGSLTGRYLVLLTVRDVIVFTVHATRGTQANDQTVPLSIVNQPLASVEFSPNPVTPGGAVSVKVNTLFAPDALSLSGPGVKVALKPDPNDVTLWRGAFTLPADANGRTELILSGGNTRVTLEQKVTLIVKAAP